MSKSLKKLIDINRLREFKNKLVGTDSAYVQTGAVDQTVGGTKTFSKPIVGSVTGSSGSCTGNAATATKLATARSLWGNNFDGSAAITGAMTGVPSIEFKPEATTSNHGGYLDFHYNQSTADYTSRIIESASGTLSINHVTITTGGVVTATTFNGALAASAIRAQWYAAFPDGAEAHNAMWGGRNITAAFNNGTVSANIANGTFKDIFPGDYITKQVTISGTAYTVNWVVADCDYWWHKGDQNNGMETHHVVIVPQVPISNYYMNATNNTKGGYAESRMYTQAIPACATGIVNAFGSDHILTFRDFIVREVDTSSISSGAPFWTGASFEQGWYGAQCNLMCERMVYGMPAFSSSAREAGVATRQMSAFRLSERLINYNRQSWWLRDVVSSAIFALVDGNGTAGPGNASYSLGVRPFALLR